MRPEHRLVRKGRQKHLLVSTVELRSWGREKEHETSEEGQARTLVSGEVRTRKGRQQHQLVSKERQEHGLVRKWR